MARKCTSLSSTPDDTQKAPADASRVLTPKQEPFVRERIGGRVR